MKRIPKRFNTRKRTEAQKKATQRNFYIYRLKNMQAELIRMDVETGNRDFGVEAIHMTKLIHEIKQAYVNYQISKEKKNE